MPGSPEQPRSPEYKGIPYLRYARFSAEDSQLAYDTLQASARNPEIGGSFSVFRLAQSWSEDFTERIIDPNRQFVVILGETIPDLVQQKVEAVFARGDQEARIPDTIIAEMAEKRLANLGKPYTEKHHDPFGNLQKKNPNKEKLRRKQQKDSRRRNRGK